MDKKEIILDTDLGSDCDDVMALTYLLYAQKFLNASILAVTHCLKTPYGIPAVSCIFRKFNEKIPPLGKMEGGADLPDSYAKKLAEAFAVSDDYSDVDTAVKTMRKALVSAKNKCVICAIGQFTNVAALLNSTPDEISDLRGVCLVNEKCEQIIVMGGKFIDETDGSRQAEWNIKWDVAAAKTVVELSPVDVSFIPFEVGEKVITGKRAVDKYGDNNPLTKSFTLFTGAVNGRSSWDPITAVYAIEGVKNFLVKSKRGNVTFAEDGATYFNEDEKGKCFVISLNYNNYATEEDCLNAVAEYIDDCAEKYLATRN